eukprot:jgi/Pico_ML_1/52678/g3352.t1
MSEADGGWRAAQAGDVVFNEAMIDDANGRADWIEFKNVRDVEVDIRQLVLSDRDEGLELVLGQPGCPESIPAGGYLVLSRDSDGDDPCKFEFGLGNKEQLILRQGDVLVDSVAWNDEDIPTGKPIELTKNRDGFVDSVFFHKEKGTPLKKGLLMDAQKRNYDRWDLYRISSNHLLIPVKRTEGSFEEEVNYLERFVLDRARWMDANLSSL